MVIENLLEFAAATITLYSVVLGGKASKHYWSLGGLGAGLYVVVFVPERLWFSVGLQLVYIGLSLWGYRRWAKGSVVQRGMLSPPSVRDQIVFAISLGVLGVCLSHAFPSAERALSDSILTVFSLGATFLNIKAATSAWGWWVVINFLYAAQYFSVGLFWTAGLYAVLFVLSGMNLYQWWRAKKDLELDRSISQVLGKL